MSELRDLRRAVGLKQEEFAELLGVPIETLRTWDSERRHLPPQILQRAKRAVVDLPRNTERLSLDQLARELGVHERTLQAAARTGVEMRPGAEFETRRHFYHGLVCQLIELLLGRGLGLRPLCRHRNGKDRDQEEMRDCDAKDPDARQPGQCVSPRRRINSAAPRITRTSGGPQGH
jgi:DNA-binding transcriptional regulator YiaG